MIITDESLLRAKCIDVLPEEINGLRQLLENELKNSSAMGHPGSGLAAPQIGINKRIAIIRFVDGPNIYNITLVNVIIKTGYDVIDIKEGCLSLPGKEFKTKRFNEIHVIDNAVEPKSFIAAGLLSICIQHELDHLDGKLISDFPQ